MVRTAEAKRFFAAWQALRADNDIPHYRRLFQELPRDALPQLMMYEQMPGDCYIVRFMGTYTVELWGADITGRDLLAEVNPRVATASRRNLAAVLDHPCGMLASALYSLSSRDEFVAEGLILPVANDPGLPRRILCFAQQLTPPYPIAADRPNVAEREWVDIGSGVPRRRPAV